MTTPFAPRPAANPQSDPQDLARSAALTPNLAASRRGLLLAPLLAALPASLLSGAAQAIDPSETQVTLPDQYQWKPALPGAPPRSVETAPVFGATDKPGPYVVVIRWYPGYMSAPHTYVTDPALLCAVRHLVGEFGRSVRARGHRSGAGRRLRPTRRAHAALRRGQERREGAGRHRHHWAGADRV